MYPNPTCEISNYIIEADDNLYNLYLSPEMQTESGIKRCLATAQTIAELIEYIQTKQGDLRDTDILVEFIDSSVFQFQYFIVPADDTFVLYENINNKRNPIDEDKDIDKLVCRNFDKNLILQF